MISSQSGNKINKVSLLVHTCGLLYFYTQQVMGPEYHARVSSSWLLTTKVNDENTLSSMGSISPSGGLVSC